MPELGYRAAGAGSMARRFQPGLDRMPVMGDGHRRNPAFYAVCGVPAASTVKFDGNTAGPPRGRQLPLAH
jgi:hypothetical protein